MTAEEARKVAKYFHEEKSGSQLFEILSQIQLDANRGMFEMFYYANIHELVKEKLEEMGYMVDTPITHRNEVAIKISWK